MVAGEARAGGRAGRSTGAARSGRSKRGARLWGFWPARQAGPATASQPARSLVRPSSHRRRRRPKAKGPLASMRISILNRPLFNSLFGVIDLKQGASCRPLARACPFARVVIAPGREPFDAGPELTTLPGMHRRGHARHLLRRAYLYRPSALRKRGKGGAGVAAACCSSALPLQTVPRLTRRPPCLGPRQLFNKVAGLYGLFGACFAGATIGQLSFYLYSTASLAGFVWGLKAVVEVRLARPSLACSQASDGDSRGALSRDPRSPVLTVPKYCPPPPRPPILLHRHARAFP